MPRNPEQDQDRPEDQAQDPSKEKIWPKGQDQEKKSNSDRQSDSPESLPEGSNRDAGLDDERVGGDGTPRDDEDPATKSKPESGQDQGDTVGGG